MAVQGLGAHKYYTWVKKKSSTTQKEKSKPLSGSDFIPRRCKIAQTPETNDAAQSSNPAEIINNSSVEVTSVEVMWLRDLLPRFFPNARIATYSYESDWRQDVKTNLRECGQQLLNNLYQHRSSEKVSFYYLLGICTFIYTEYHDVGSSTAIDTHWTQPGRSGHKAGLFYRSWRTTLSAINL